MQADNGGWLVEAAAARDLSRFFAPEIAGNLALRVSSNVDPAPDLGNVPVTVSGRIR